MASSPFTKPCATCGAEILDTEMVEYTVAGYTYGPSGSKFPKYDAHCIGCCAHNEILTPSEGTSE